MRLENKVIVVTGGSGLLGSEMLHQINLEGGIGINADITNTNDINKKEYHLDITQENSIVSLVNTLIGKYGRIDGWVNNAYPRTKDWGTKFEEVSIASWRNNIDMHLNGYFICCQKILEQMKRQRSGSLINLASIYGIVGPDFSIYEGTHMGNPGGYAAIKGGLINLSRYLASYYGPYNIRVNCISPGGIFDNQAPIFVENYEKKVPMRRMGTPKDISPSVAFLLSDASSYITGHNLVIDGGWVAI